MKILTLLLLPGCILSSDIAITTSALPEARVALPYEATLEAVEPKGEVSWALDAGELPPGLELDPATGLISGEPTLSGRYDFTVVAMDDRGETTTQLSIDVPDVFLISGFGPFEGYPVNPSWEAIEELDQVRLGAWDLRVIELPVTWAGAWPPLEAEIDRLSPTVVMGTGVADTDTMRYELVAHNIQSGTDVDGEYVSPSQIIDDGPSELETALPTVEMAEAVDALGLSTQQSDNAARYLCNHVFYHIMYLAQERDYIGGFVHVPPAPTDHFEIADITASHEEGILVIEELMGSEARRARTPISTAPTYTGEPTRR